MIERERTAPQKMSEGGLSTTASDNPFPSLDRTLTIARLGSCDPGSLTQDDIKDLSRVMLMHYARMGVA